jgi:hypothetical protein
VRRPALLDSEDLEARVVDDNDAVLRLETAVGRVDLVRAHYYDSPFHVIERFDFTACAAAVGPGGFITHHVDWEDHAPARKLVVNALPTPVASFWRLHRFLARGWRIGEEDYRGLLDAAIASGEDWSGEQNGYESTDGPPKGMPYWAQAAWDALRSDLGDRMILPRVMRRAVLDDDWRTLLEATARLAAGEQEQYPISLLNMTNQERNEVMSLTTGVLRSRAARATMREFLYRTLFGDVEQLFTTGAR